MVRATLQSASSRASAIRLVVTDCDGVLTDAGIYYSERGEELRRFSVRDGMGIERLRQLALPTWIITGEASAIIGRRGRKIGAEVILGAKKKLAVASELAAAKRLSLRELAYIGDDVNDLELLQAVGLSACPANAEPAVQAAVDLVLSRKGGDGAFREFADFILAHRAEPTDPDPLTRELSRAVPARTV
jgi:YrbI family 3-deoxy-D-manno-octulosonate 8-phosphate phosphatase